MALVKQIWKDRAKGEVNPLAFSDLAQKMAQQIDQEGLNPRGRPEKNKSTQLRKYYDVIFNLNQRARMAGANWNAILAQLHRQLALVHYAKGRKLVTDSFVSMMDELIRAINKPEDLQVVTDFLEAFMAFYKEYRGNN
jgi:CRISPR-associated protein Csm2